MSWRSIPHPSSGPRSPRKVLYPDTLLRPPFPERRGGTTLRISGNYFPFNMALHPRRHGNSSASLQETEISHLVKGPQENSSFENSSNMYNFRFS